MKKKDQNIPYVYYVTPDFPPESNAGSARAYALAKALSKNSIVRVVSNKRAEEKEGVSVIRLPIRNPQNNKHLIQRILRELAFSFFAFWTLLFAPRNSIFIVSPPPFSLLLLYLLVPRKSGELRILDVRDIYPHAYVDGGLVAEGSATHLLLSALETRAYSKSDIVFTVCDTLAAKIRQRAPNTEVRLVLNGYGEAFRPSPKKKSASRVIHPITVISHGNFGRFQNIDLLNRLVRATLHLNLIYRFVGFGAHFDQIASGQNVEKNCAVEHEKIPELLSLADLGLSVRTSNSVGRNAIPVKILEYVGAGIPSLVFPIMPDLKPLANSGAIRQFESEQLQDAITFLSDVSLRGADFESMQRAVGRIRSDYSRQLWVDIAVAHIKKAYNERKI